MALGDRISRIVRANCNDMTGKLEPVEGAGFIATGAATGAGVSATLGGMGLVGGFGGLSIGMAPVAAAGAMAGAAEAAMKQGREDLARQALERKLSHQQTATTVKTQLEQLTARIEALRGDLSVIERTIAEV
jgi:phage shock protein A